ncbi:chloride channel CLIC-like protein 1 isoform X2 [Hyperolius riggenbachi]|uniref:chloride channel CLIC-like protein 1 isoform X2 n=1 Tax=Hyperolius riggenbachi TaxID=752182 RepID=UPI0035A3B9AC
MDFFLLISICLATCHGTYQDLDWIDPTDMIHYDAAAGRMRKEREDISQEENDSRTEYANQKYGMDVDELKQIEEYRKTEQMPQNSEPAFRRFLLRILDEAKQLGLPDASQPEIHYNAEVVLTKEKVAEIWRYLSDRDWHAGALDEALGSTLVGFKYYNKEECRWNFEDYVGTDPMTVVMISLTLLTVVVMIATQMWTRIGLLSLIPRICVIIFLTSLPWNWMYLYRVAFAEQQAELTKMKTSDEACGRERTWLDGLFGWFKSSSSFQNDPCEEYYKSLTINPVLQVAPIKALSFTIADIPTEAMKHLCKGIGESLQALLAKVPYFYQPAVLMIIALALFVCCCWIVGLIGKNRRVQDGGERCRLQHTCDPGHGMQDRKVIQSNKKRLIMEIFNIRRICLSVQEEMCASVRAP